MQRANNKSLKFFLYVRRSQDAEDRQMASLDDQTTEMNQRAKLLGIDIVDTLSESRSAKAPGRPVFDAMIERIKKGEADGILCWKLNRLSRNPVDAGTIQWLLQTNVLKCVQTFDRYYLPTDNVVAMGVEMLQAIQFVNDLSVDVKRGMRNKAKRGWMPQSWLPPGYKHNKGYEEGDPEILSTSDLQIVKVLMGGFIEGGCSKSDIHRKAAALGLRRKKTGRPYCRNAIVNMLRNPMYMGKFEWVNAEGDRVFIDGHHEAIITEKQYQRIQLLLGKQGRVTRAKSYDFAFRGPFTCGECGCSITADRKLQCICTGCKHKFSCKEDTACTKCGLEIENMTNPSIIDKTYYVCTKKSKVINCTQRGIEEEDLAEEINKTLLEMEIDQDFYQWSKWALKEVHHTEVKEHHEAHGRVIKRKQELIERADNLVMMRADGEIGPEQFQKMKEAVSKELNTIDAEGELVSDRVRHWVEIADGYLTFTETASKIFNETTDLKVKKDIVQTLGSNLMIRDKKPLIYITNPLVQLKENREKFASDLGRFEPKKALDKQGLSSEKAMAFSDLCAELEAVRHLCLA